MPIFLHADNMINKLIEMFGDFIGMIVWFEKFNITLVKMEKIFCRKKYFVHNLKDQYVTQIAIAFYN